MAKTLSYSIENTQESDLDCIYQLFDEAILYQKRKGAPAWPGYDKEVLKRDIANQQQFKIVKTLTYWFFMEV